MEEFYRDFGRRVRAARLAAGMSQKTLADRVGLTRTSVTNLELGQQHVPLHMLLLLARAVGAAPLDLLPEDVGTAEVVAPELLRGLRPEDQQWVLGVVRDATMGTAGGVDEGPPQEP